MHTWAHSETHVRWVSALENVVSTMSTPAPEHFTRWVHDAYNHLYDIHHLQSHPLGELLTPPATADAAVQRSQHLRRVLLDAIQSLRPPPGAPAQSPDWRLYSLLELRYIERLSPAEAMQQLSLSKSQFFRDQGRALELVTELLWKQLSPSAQAALAADATLPNRNTEAASNAAPGDDAPPVEFHTATWRRIQLSELLDALTPVLRPLTETHHVHIATHALYELPPVRGDRVLLRQALLNVLTYAVTSTAAPTVALHGSHDDGRVTLRLHFVAAQPPTPPPADSLPPGARLKLAAQIMETMGGALSEATTADRYTITLVWPPIDQKTLLMIDDNEGLAHLFRRYLAGEPWQLVWARNGAEARHLLASTTPAVILLDIMMPEEDGWEILVGLQQQQPTPPVLICSVVNEPTLAASLGAAGYLVKPVSQEALRAALAPWQ